MSAVPALDSGPNGSAASLDMLQDLLYDIIATDGADVEGDLPVEEVERFLHAHARSPHSREAFLAFFEAHGISAQVSPTMLGVDAPSLIAEVVPLSQAAAPTTGNYTPVDGSISDVAVAVERAPVRSARWAALVWAAVALGVLCAGVGIGVGYQTLTSMRSDLADARQLSVAQQRALEQLETRTSQLQAGVSQNGALIRHVDDRSELLLDSLLPMPIDLPVESATAAGR